MHEGRQRQTKGGQEPVIERLRHHQCTICSIRFAPLQSFRSEAPGRAPPLPSPTGHPRPPPPPQRRPSPLAIAFALAALSPCASQASDWPTRPVTIIVPFV